jgi:hypothetical protein
MSIMMIPNLLGGGVKSVNANFIITDVMMTKKQKSSSSSSSSSSSLLSKNSFWSSMFPKVSDPSPWFVSCPLACGRHDIVAINLKNHVDNECLLRQVACSLGCGILTTASDLSFHVNFTCRLRRLVCPDNCGENIFAVELGQHRHQNCHRRLVECPLACGMKIIFSETKQHTDHHCLNRQVFCNWCGVSSIAGEVVNHEKEKCESYINIQNEIDQALWTFDFEKVMMILNNEPGISSRMSSLILTAATVFDCDIIIKKMIEIGLNYKIKNSDGQTALHIAATKGHSGVVMTLLTSASPLSLSSSSSSLSILASSARASSSSPSSSSSLSLSSSSSSSSSSLHVVDDDFLTCHDLSGRSALACAVFHNREIAAFLILRAIVDSKQQKRTSPAGSVGDGIVSAVDIIRELNFSHDDGAGIVLDEIWTNKISTWIFNRKDKRSLTGRPKIIASETPWKYGA